MLPAAPVARSLWSRSGIITFGHEAQPIFAALTPDRQDAAYREVTEAVAARLGTTVSGLVVHRDEAADHAHFQCPGFTRDGMPVSKIAKREALRDLQTIAAEIMGRHAPGIERGTSRWQRIAAGEDYADTVHKSAAEMRSRLPAEIAAREAELVAAQEKLDKNTALLAKAQATAEGKRAEKARRNAVTYERRMEAARSELAGIEADLKRLRGLQDSIRAENRKLAKDGERIAQENGQKAAESRRLDEALAQKKTRIASLRARLQSLNAAYPITDLQIDVMATFVADLCRIYRIPVTRRTVLSHAEVQPTLGIKQNAKWDISWLPGMDKPGDPVAVGDQLRARIGAAMGQPATETVAYTPLLRRGSTGDAVEYLQSLLAERDFDPGPIDGAFGARTARAAVEYQKSSGLAPDGIIGPMTWAALFKGD
ncbi:peptidoglycan-binding protein [Paracoccus lutimaris]|uniref:Putative peptidoglycan binding protein n=1 Tax=Paracoccus lutimaris TaxID=1490030 RepID=A0A368YC07_9RHOB|nr:peptidoglycan-binding protein [Paracoccus lutimaris]RCW77732.1 putative peptidoglycan binding protein [Paracoccus lutimaris]